MVIERGMIGKEKNGKAGTGMNGNITVRKVMVGTVIAGVLTAVIHIASMLTIDKKLEYKEVAFSTDHIIAELEGYRIGFVSDTHAMTEAELEAVVQELQDRDLNILLLGGDFAQSEERLKRAVEILSKVNAADGVYGVAGNHDMAEELFDVMEGCGIVPLPNSGIHIRDGFYLAGTNDLWSGTADIDEAVRGAGTDDFVLLLTHNPDITMQQDTSGTDLVLSGHTHGGQITFHGIWAPELTLRKTITDYGQRFMSGWCENKQGTPVYVSRGTGYLNVVPRIFARPQAVIIELSQEEKN